MFKKLFPHSLGIIGILSLPSSSAHEIYQGDYSNKLLNILDKKFQLNLTESEEAGLKRALSKIIQKEIITRHYLKDHQILRNIGHSLQPQNEIEAKIKEEFLNNIEDVQIDAQDPAETLRLLGEGYSNLLDRPHLGIHESRFTEGGGRTEVVSK